MLVLLFIIIIIVYDDATSISQVPTVHQTNSPAWTIPKIHRVMCGNFLSLFII